MRLLHLFRFPFWEFRCKPLGNSFNPPPLIYHLTNRYRCGNLQDKVPLIVSPSRPSFDPPANVFSQPSNFCAVLQPTSLAVSHCCGLLVSLASLFRSRFLCFHQLADSFAKTPGVGVPPRHLRALYLSVLSPLIDFQNLCFHKFTNPFSSNPFSCTSIQNPRVSPLFTPLYNSSTLTLVDSCTPLFRLDFVPRTKYCSTANYCSQECGW